MVLGAVVTLPVLIGLGAAWKAKSDVAGLYENQRALELENANYRQATEALSGQIESLQSAIADLGARSALEPSLAKAMANLPAFVKARAMGGGATARGPKTGGSYAATLAALTSPDDTFGLLRTLLEGLESRLSLVEQSVERRNALAAATPSIWPAHGWLSSPMGYRTDPINGAAATSTPASTSPASAVSRSTPRRPGTVTLRGRPGRLRQPDRHRSRLRSRNALRPPAVLLRRRNEQVQRGDVIGHVGAPAAPRATICTTRCSPTARSSTRCSCSPIRSRATSKSPPLLRFLADSVAPRLQSVDIPLIKVRRLA